MNSKKNDGFYLAIGMFAALSACVLCGICGKDLIREVGMLDKIMMFILKLIGLVFLTAVLVYGVIACIYNFCLDIKTPGKWKLVNNIGEYKNCQYVIFSEKVGSFPNDKYYSRLKHAVFYSSSLEIKNRAFSSCKKLKEITFYEIPKSIEKDAFLRCDRLSLIRVYGIKDNWDKLKIFIPSNPKIEFIPPIITDEKLTEEKIININCEATLNVATKGE